MLLSEFWTSLTGICLSVYHCVNKLSITLYLYFNNYLPNPLCLLCLQNSYYRFTPKFCQLFKWALSMLIPISYSIHFIFFPFNISATSICYVCLLACYTHNLRCSFMIILVFPFFPSGVVIQFLILMLSSFLAYNIVLIDLIKIRFSFLKGDAEG